MLLSVRVGTRVRHNLAVKIRPTCEMIFGSSIAFCISVQAARICRLQQREEQHLVSIRLLTKADSEAEIILF